MAFGAAAPATGESDMRNGYIGKETEQILRSLLDRYPALEKCETQIERAYEAMAVCFSSGGKTADRREWRKLFQMHST